jgi:hypothetical protein
VRKNNVLKHHALNIYVEMEVKTPFILNLYSSRTSEVKSSSAVKEVKVTAG